MSPQSLGKTLIIADPASNSGRGEAAAIFATRFFSKYNSCARSCSVRMTEGEGDAKAMASAASEYDTVIALGSDGDIHEVVNGLMTIKKDNRPSLGIIPVGSSNDFARTIGVTSNDPEKAIAEIMSGEERPMDLGKVNDTYFVQTLSFGLDAATALSVRRRWDGHEPKKSSLPYFFSGARLVATELQGWSYRATIDGEVIEGVEIAFAVQNGPTYGGGFRICPDAVPNDGMLDLCFTSDKPSRVKSLALLGLMRFGKHTHSPVVGLRRLKHMEVEFFGEEQPPCQADGEEVKSQRYAIDVKPSELRVIVPSDCAWQVSE